MWKIENSAEGVLTFPNCLLPTSAYNAEVIKFTFPLEIMTFSPPVIDNSEPKLLKFSNQRGKLALCNLSGDPPISNEPLNESKIRHYNSLFNPRSEFQEPYQESLYRNPPVHPPAHLPPGNPQVSGDVRSYDPNLLPPNLAPQIYKLLFPKYSVKRNTGCNQQVASTTAHS